MPVRAPIRVLVAVAFVLSVATVYHLHPWLNDMFLEYQYTPSFNVSTADDDEDYRRTVVPMFSTKHKGYCEDFKDRFKKAHPLGTDPNDDNPLIYIASATEFQPGEYSWMIEGTAAFERCSNLQPWMQCSYSPSTNKSYLKKTHAVLFHPRFMSKKPPDVYELPKHNRSLAQKWVFYESEAPTNVWNYVSTNETYWKLFNITATFTSDSDIPLAYHHMKCLPRENWLPNNTNYAANKTKSIAWFVSHCKTSSRRELYAKVLKKYLPVDIYGSCSNSTKCLRNTDSKKEEEECMFDLLNTDYKFYLSFENSICSEYVTEKFNRIVRNVDVIPIVLGGADYANIIPEGSYIDVRDFRSPKELSKYLEKVANDDDLYNKYINRKNAFSCRSKRTFNCNLCEYLHKHRYEKQIVYDAANFWSTSLRCTSPKDFYKTIAPDFTNIINFSQIPGVFL